jgi:hypothetical protein
MAEDFVYIRLKEHGDDVQPGRVSRAAYEQQFAAKGWVIVPDAEAELIGSPATMAEMRAGTAAPASEPEPVEEAATTGRSRKG